MVDDEDLGKTILEIAVRGKRGFGYCKSTPGAVRPFERLRSRLRPARIDGVNTPEKSSVTSTAATEPWRLPEPTDLIFPKWRRELFKTILEEQNLRVDREGRPRTPLALHAQRPRRRLTTAHKLFWVGLRKVWARLKQPLIV